MLIAIASVYAQKFGIPMKYATGGISQIAMVMLQPVFAGILVREVPSISGILPKASQTTFLILIKFRGSLSVAISTYDVLQAPYSRWSCLYAKRG